MIHTKGSRTTLGFTAACAASDPAAGAIAVAAAVALAPKRVGAKPMPLLALVVGWALTAAAEQAAVMCTVDEKTCLPQVKPPLALDLIV